MLRQSLLLGIMVVSMSLGSISFACGSDGDSASLAEGEKTECALNTRAPSSIDANFSAEYLNQIDQNQKAAAAEEDKGAEDRQRHEKAMDTWFRR